MCASLFLKIFLMVNKNIASIFLLLTYILYIHFWNLNMFQGEIKHSCLYFLKELTSHRLHECLYHSLILYSHWSCAVISYSDQKL